MDCILSTTGINNSGYSYKYDHRTKKVQGAHRIVLQDQLGRALEKGEVARHTCSNRHCINPDHVLLGSYSDNNRDKLKDQGNKRYLDVLTVKKIKKLIKEGKSNKEIYQIYPISKYQMYDLRRGRRWQWIQP